MNPSTRRRRLLILTAVLSAVELLAGCATSPAPVEAIVLPASFWQNKQGKIGVALVEAPRGTVHMYGPRDALDRAIATKADSQFINYLHTVRPGAFNQLAEGFSAGLRKRGYTVEVIAQPVESTWYATLQTKAPTNKVEADLAPDRAKYGVDRLLLLSVDRFGAYRDYFVFVPTAAPMAIFQVEGKLVDLASNEMLWRATMASKQNVIPIEGDWNQPPDYPNVTLAIRRAEQDAVIYLENAFFSGAP